jgi:hypothetical protein
VHGQRQRDHEENPAVPGLSARTADDSRTADARIDRLPAGGENAHLVTGRRLAAVLLAAAGFVPAALTAVLALHVVLEHDPDPARGHAAAAAVRDAPDRALARASSDHDHEIGAQDDVAARSAPAPGAAISPAARDASAGATASKASAALAAPPGAPPPRAAGSPLLALLSILRV